MYATMTVLPIIMFGIPQLLSLIHISAITALETAVKALDTASTKPSSGSATVTPAPIEAALKAAGDINYQNFDLYAYWAYEKAMKAGNAIIDACLLYTSRCV